SAQVDALFLARAEELSNLAFESLDLTEPAQAMGLAILTTDFFVRSGGVGIAVSGNVINAAFSSDVLEERLNSELVQVDANRAVVIHVDEHRPAELRPLDEVRGEIEALLHSERRREQVRTIGEGFANSLQRGDNIDALLEAQGLSWEQFDNVERSAPNVHP